jgi:hypothetical protein
MFSGHRLVRWSSRPHPIMVPRVAEICVDFATFYEGVPIPDSRANFARLFFRSIRARGLICTMLARVLVYKNEGSADAQNRTGKPH